MYISLYIYTHNLYMSYVLLHQHWRKIRERTQPSVWRYLLLFHTWRMGHAIISHSTAGKRGTGEMNKEIKRERKIVVEIVVEEGLPLAHQWHSIAAVVKENSLGSSRSSTRLVGFFLYFHLLLVLLYSISPYLCVCLSFWLAWLAMIYRLSCWKRKLWKIASVDWQMRSDSCRV